MAEQNKLKELFDQRDRSQHEITRQIFDQIEHVTDAVQAFLQIDDSENQQVFSWENVALTDEAYPDHGGLLVLVGSIYYGGEPINIIRIGIPLDKAVEGTKDDIVQFLQHNAKQEDQLTEEEQQMMDQLADHVSDVPIEQIDDQSEQEYDLQADWGQTFDLDQLTPEQQQQLRLYSLTTDSDTRTN